MKKIISICLIMILICSLVSCSKDKGFKEVEAKLYFVNSSKTNIAEQTRKIKYSEKELLAEAVLNELLKGPSGTDATAIIPKNTKLLSLEIEDGCATCDFSADIYSSVETDNILIRTTILKTLTSLSSITSVKILVNSEPYVDSDGVKIGILNSSDIVYDTDPEDEQHRYVRLYFSDSQAQKLIAEARKVTLSPKESVEMRILKELLKGPEKEFLVKTIPEETKILSVETKEGVCFVNLSQEFISKHSGGSSSEMITVYSIVNSLTQLENVDKVQFLIEGQKTEVYIHMVFNEPFVRNSAIIE